MTVEMNPLVDEAVSKALKNPEIDFPRRQNGMPMKSNGTCQGGTASKATTRQTQLSNQKLITGGSPEQPGAIKRKRALNNC